MACVWLFQVDKKVITAVAEGRADPDARLLKVESENIVRYILYFVNKCKIA